MGHIAILVVYNVSFHTEYATIKMIIRKMMYQLFANLHPEPILDNETAKVHQILGRHHVKWVTYVKIS